MDDRHTTKSTPPLNQKLIILPLELLRSLFNI